MQKEKKTKGKRMKMQNLWCNRKWYNYTNLKTQEKKKNEEKQQLRIPKISDRSERTDPQN